MQDPFFQYLEFEKRYSPHTLISYRTDLDQFTSYCKNEFDISALEQVDYNIIRSWVVNLMQSSLETKSVNRKLACLKSYFKFLMKRGVIVSNPAQRVKTPKLKKRLPMFIEENHMNILLDDVAFENSFEGSRDKLTIELLYGTGIRLSELLNLKMTDINIYDNTIKVKGKGSKERVVPIHSSLANAIVEYNNLKKNTFLNLVDEPFLVCTSNGKKAYPMLIQRIIKKYLSLVSNTEKKSPHILRHSFATHMLNNGADLNAIKDLLGHANLAATQIYTHNSLDKLRNVFKQSHPKA